VDRLHPFYSIIIPYWNSSQTIRPCLDALSAQSYPDFELLLVDNGSTVPMAADLAVVYPHLPLQLFRLEKNTGFAAVNNFAATKASGEYLVLLNTDAFPAADWLEQLRRAIRQYPGCFFASRLIMAQHPELMDGSGDVYHASGLAWRKAYNTPVASDGDQDREVFSACAAAAVYPLEAYRKVGGFDEDFFSYSEDVDLGFRLRLAGYRCMYIPLARVNHLGSASTSRRSDFSVYYGHRNLVWTFIKDVPGVWVWLLAPFHVAINLLMIALGISRKQGKIMLQAKLDALRGIPVMWKKRRLVQSSRVVPSASLLRVMDWNPFSPLIKLLRR
jgi:GT2 family glycosyltransferase